MIKVKSHNRAMAGVHHVGNRCADEQARAGAALHEHDPLVLERLRRSKVLVDAVARYLGSALAWVWKVSLKPAEVEPVG